MLDRGGFFRRHGQDWVVAPGRQGRDPADIHHVQKDFSRPDSGRNDRLGWSCQGDFGAGGIDKFDWKPVVVSDGAVVARVVSTAIAGVAWQAVSGKSSSAAKARISTTSVWCLIMCGILLQKVWIQDAFHLSGIDSKSSWTGKRGQGKRWSSFCTFLRFSAGTLSC